VLVPDEQGKEQFRAVTVGLTQDRQTRVLKGVRQGERVFIVLQGQKLPVLLVVAIRSRFNEHRFSRKCQYGGADAERE